MPVLAEALDRLGVLPERDGPSLAKHERQHRGAQDLVVDGVERRRQRPKQAEKQTIHCPETIAVTATPVLGDQASVGYPGPGGEPVRPTPIPIKDPTPTAKTADAALLRDAKMYSSTYGVDIDESIRRLLLQPEIGELNRQLTEKEAATFQFGDQYQAQPGRDHVVSSSEAQRHLG